MTWSDHVLSLTQCPLTSLDPFSFHALLSLWAAANPSNGNTVLPGQPVRAMWESSSSLQTAVPVVTGFREPLSILLGLAVSHWVTLGFSNPGLMSPDKFQHPLPRQLVQTVKPDLAPSMRQNRNGPRAHLGTPHCTYKTLLWLFSRPHPSIPGPPCSVRPHSPWREVLLPPWGADPGDLFKTLLILM